jgi:hypothetical protein
LFLWLYQYCNGVVTLESNKLEPFNNHLHLCFRMVKQEGHKGADISCWVPLHTFRDPQFAGDFKEELATKTSSWKNGADNTTLKAILSVFQCEGLHLLVVFIMKSFGPCITNLDNANWYGTVGWLAFRSNTLTSKYMTGGFAYFYATRVVTFYFIFH